MRRLLLLVIAASSVCAQIQDLAVTDDGGQLYFSTPYRFSGSGQTNYAKIFRFTERGFELFRQIELQAPPGSRDTNFYLARRPMVSGDGTIVGYTAGRNCSGGSHCVVYAYYQGCLASAAGADRCESVNANDFLGQMTLSPDGAYALSFERFSTSLLVESGGSVWTDLATGSSTTLPDANPIGDGKQALANGGALLLADSLGPFLWNRGLVLRLPIPAVAARLSANGQVVVYTTASFELHSYRISLGQDLVLVKQAGSPILSPWITNDGSRVTFILNGHVYVENTDGSGGEDLVSPPEGVAESIISGFGNAVFVVTSTSRLLRIDLPGKTVTQLSPEVPVARLVSGVSAIGAILDFDISGAAPTDATPEVTGQVPVLNPPVIAASGSQITIQVPWEASAGSSLEITFPRNPGPFEWVPTEYAVALVAPSFYTLPGTQYIPVAIHQDFSALVTADSPARAGEIVHLYATGLGPVVPSIPTGVPAPIGTPITTQFPMSCKASYDVYPSEPLSLLFAGLAPAMIGVEQVDIQIPSDIPNPGPRSGGLLMWVLCSVASPSIVESLDPVYLPVLP